MQVFAKGGWAGADVGFAMSDLGTGITATLDKWVNGGTFGSGVGLGTPVLDSRIRLNTLMARLTWRFGP